jgi:hypothetical protein
MAAASAVLIAAALLVPSPAVAQESSLDEIYAALRPENLRTTTGRTSFSPGEPLEFLLDLVNTSEEPLVVPLTDFFGSSFHLVGTQQAWIERLGPEPSIPSIPPIIGRKGTWYASGGSIIAVEGLSGNTIPPRGRVARQASVFYSTVGFPSGRYRFHVEYKPLFGGLFDVIADGSLDLTIGAVDETPPVITAPADITVDATAPDGATVVYAASATDDVDGPVPVTCAPVPGGSFPIGTTTVTCSATDSSGNGASASFEVHVKDASEQLADLLVLVGGVGPGSSLADKITAARGALASGHSSEACRKLAAFTKEAEAQSGKKLTSEQATQLVGAANRIRAVLSC